MARGTVSAKDRTEARSERGAVLHPTRPRVGRNSAGLPDPVEMLHRSQEIDLPLRTAPQRGHLRVVMLVLLVPAIIGGCWLAKGMGLKTWIINKLDPNKPPHPFRFSNDIAEGPSDPAVRFEQIPLPAATGESFTCVEVGPDHRLYASSDDGRIFRYTINPDGTLASPQVISSLQAASGGKQLLIGFCFDPSATAQNPIIWVSNGFYGFQNVPDWTGKISRMSGPDLQTVEDVVIHLPRSIRDHATNQPHFGPDGALYFPQGSESSSGGPDPGWGNRPEHLLNASILRLDTKKVTPGQPLDALTADGGGTYDPYASHAPLTIYAGGIRNAYDLVWTSDRRLFVPVNGASNGGNTPAGGGAPSLQNLKDAEHDWLFRITPGKYYGHPNPQQHHFVLNGGNPNGTQAADRVLEYPVGTQPDSDWEPPVFDFGLHDSADGIIQYHGNAFDGKLDGKLLICRYNAGADIIVLGIDGNGNINRVETGNVGLTGFVSPLDLTEDPRTGNIYVAEYGGHSIILLRPLSPSASSTPANPPSSPGQSGKPHPAPRPSND